MRKENVYGSIANASLPIHATIIKLQSERVRIFMGALFKTKIFNRRLRNDRYWNNFTKKMWWKNVHFKRSSLYFFLQPSFVFLALMCFTSLYFIYVLCFVFVFLKMNCPFWPIHICGFVKNNTIYNVVHTWLLFVIIKDSTLFGKHRISFSMNEIFSRISQDSTIWLSFRNDSICQQNIVCYFGCCFVVIHIVCFMFTCNMVHWNL